MRWLLMAAAIGLTPFAAYGQRTQPGVLAACSEEGLEDAARCLRSNLSEADRQALLAGDTSSSIRGRIDALIRREILREPEGSSVSRMLAARGIRNPMLQSAVLTALARGQQLDLAAVARLDPTAAPATPLELLERRLGLPTPTSTNATPAGNSNDD